MHHKVSHQTNKQKNTNDFLVTLNPLVIRMFSNCRYNLVLVADTLTHAVIGSVTNTENQHEYSTAWLIRNSRYQSKVF
jgi:hypothetical protein